MSSDTTELRITRVIHAPRAVVWSAWADREQLARWWIPAPLSCRVSTLALQPGGGFETQMSENGEDFTPHVAGCFLEVIPAEKIVFTTVLTEGWKPNAPWLPITAIITLEDHGEHTLYSARVLHKDAEDCRKHFELGFEEGWGTALAQLDHLFA